LSEEAVSSQQSAVSGQPDKSLSFSSGREKSMTTSAGAGALTSSVVRRRFVALSLLLSLLVLAVFVLPSAHGTPPASPVSDERGAAASASLLEVGSARKLVAAPADPAEIKIVSYNIRYRAGEDLQELIKLLKDDPEIGGAALIGLQEVDRNKERTERANTPRLLAEALGMHYAWAAPPPPSPKDGARPPKKEPEEETGVAILSPYPLSDVERLVLPHEGPNRRRRAGIGATVRVGRDDVRFYSVHAETRMPVERKVEHWRIVLDDLKRHPQIKHVVVVGDFNTIKGKDVRAARQLFTEAGFATPFRDEDSTFKVVFFDFKLDWVWLRGLTPSGHGIDKKVGLSDHWPLWVRARLEKNAPLSTGSGAGGAAGE
jgi:endonuclease/exonuclease/phosphatase family metal-dependent hydrolase